MFWLILCTLSSTGIFVLFKILDKTKTPIFNAIIVNYIIASIFGFWLSGELPSESMFNSDWFLQSIIIGILFIIMFFLIGLSSQKAGISVTTVASKMSVVIPMLFAIFMFGEDFGLLKFFGIVGAVVAVSLSVYKKQPESDKFNYSLILLPLILFFGMGLVDSAVIHSKERYVNDDIASLFSASVFSFALISGLLICFVKPKLLKGFKNVKVWYLGLGLGIVNFGSIYLMIRALNSGVFQNSVVYGITNIGIVSLSVLVGTIFFKEKLSILNMFGIFMSVIAILLLTIADL